MIIQKMLEDESDIFAEYSFINSSTRKKIEEFRRKRRESEMSQDMTESVSVAPPRASRKRMSSKDRSVEPPTRHRSGVRRPPTAERIDRKSLERNDSSTFTDPLSRLRALEQRLDDMVTNAHPIDQPHRPPRPPRRERAKEHSPDVTGAAQRPLRIRTPSAATTPVDVPRQPAAPDPNSPDTQLANRLINELLEESAKGAVPQSLIDKITSSHVYDSKPLVKELFSSVVGSIAPDQPGPSGARASPTAVNAPIPHDDSYTAVANQPTPTRVEIATESSQDEDESPEKAPEAAPEASTVAVNDLGPRIYSGANTEPLPDILKDSTTPTTPTARPKSKLISASINVIIAEKPDVIAPAKLHIPDVAEEPEEEEEEESDEEDEEYSDEEATSSDTGEIVKPLYSRIGEGEETVHSVSDFEDLDIEDEDGQGLPPVNEETVEQVEMASDTESFVSAASNLPQPPATAPVLTEEEKTNEFLRGLSKRQSRGKYEKTKYVYGRSISIDDSPIMERRRVGGVQPQPEEADTLFKKATQYILQHPDQPPTPQETAVNQKDTLEVTNHWLKTADPELSNSSFECDSPAGGQGKKTPTPQDPAPNENSLDYYKVLWPPKDDVSKDAGSSKNFKLMDPPPPRKGRTVSTDEQFATKIALNPPQEPETPSQAARKDSKKIEGDYFKFPEGKKAQSPTDTSRDRDDDDIDAPISRYRYPSPDYSKRRQRMRTRPADHDTSFEAAAKLLTDTEFVSRTPTEFERALLSPVGAKPKDTLDVAAEDQDSAYRRHSYRSAIEKKKEDADPFYSYTTTHSRPLTDYMSRYDTKEPTSTSRYGQDKTEAYDSNRYGSILGYVRPRYNNDTYRTGYFNKSTEEEPVRKTSGGREKTKSLYEPAATATTDYHYTPRYGRTHTDFDSDMGYKSKSSHEVSPDRRTSPVPPRRNKSKSLYETEDSALNSVYKYEPKTLMDGYDRSQYPTSRYYQSSTAYDRTGTSRQMPTYGDVKMRNAGTYRSRVDDNVSYRRSYYDPHLEDDAKKDTSSKYSGTSR